MKRAITRAPSSIAVALALLVSGPAVPSQATPSLTLIPIRLIPDPFINGHAELYGWGAATMPDGSVLLGDYRNNRVVHYAADGTKLGTLINNNGEAPYGIGVDYRNGDIYVADTDRRQVKKFNSVGKLLLKWGKQGEGVGKFRYPSRVAVASDGRVYVADTWSNHIVVHDEWGTELFTFGSFGTGDGQFKQPHGMAFDYGTDPGVSDDRLFVVDSMNYRIQVFAPDGTFLYKFGSKGPGQHQFKGDLRGLAIDQQNDWVYVVDAAGNKIRKYTLDGTFLLAFGSTGTGPGQFIDGGREATVDGNGNLWVGVLALFKFLVFAPDGTFLFERPDPPFPPPDGGFNGPRGVGVDAFGNVFVTDTYNQQIDKFGPDGTWLLKWGIRGRDEDALNYPRMLATDPRDSSVVIADTDNHMIKKFTNDGTFVFQVGSGGNTLGKFRNPHGVDVSQNGTIYVADTRNYRVQALDEDGTALYAFGSRGSGPGQFTYPRGIGVDPVDGSLWVADASVADKVHHFTATGTYLGSLGSSGTAPAQLLNPFDVEIDESYVYVADTQMHQIKVWTRDGAFVGAYGGLGSGLGNLNMPQGLDLGPDGHLYIAEQGTERIQEWWLSDVSPPTITASPADPGNDDAPEWSFTGDVGNTLECKLTRGATVVEDFVSCGSGSRAYDLSSEPDGVYTFAVRQVDGDGDRGPASTDDYRLDREVPSSSATAPATSYADTITVDYSASDGGAGLSQVELWAKGPGDADFALAATDTAPGPTGAFSYAAAADGPHEFFTRARDAAGNYEAPPAVPDATTLVSVLKAPDFVTTLGGPGHADMYPSGLEIAPDGSVIVADTGNNTIKKFADDGTPLWSIGQFGTGIGEVNNPRDVGVDSAGNVYVADTGNNRIVKLSSSGAWLTSWKGPTGDFTGTPMGITVSGDLVYVADASKKKVRVYDTDGNQIRAFGGSGACEFSNIRDVDADTQGNVYIANYLQNNIVKMTAEGACITAWGASGTGDGQFRNPYGVQVVADPVLGIEAVYVADSNNNRVQVFTTEGAFLDKFGTAGDETVPGAFGGLRRVAVGPDGDAWGADMWGFALERYDHSLIDGFTYAQTIGGTPPPLQSDAVFNEVRGIAFDSTGVIHEVDTVNHRIVRMEPDGSILNACGTRGWMASAFNWPRGVAVDQATDQMWVADTKQSQLRVLKPTCVQSGPKIGSVGSGLANFNWPHAVAIRQSDRIAWVADTNNDRVVSYDVATRAPIAAFGSFGSGAAQFNEPRGITVDPTTGHVFVADRNNNRVVELADTGGSGISVVRILTADLNRPEGVAVDSIGRIFVADSGDNEVVVISPDGSVWKLLTEPQGFYHPENVAVDASGRILVADTYHDVIKVFAYA